MRGDDVLERLRAVFRSYLTSAGKQAARNLGTLVVLTALTQAAALASLLVVSNTLGPAGFGVFAFALSLQPYLYILGTLGTALVLFREGVRQPEQLDAITTAYQAVSLCGALLVAVLTASAAWLAPISSAEQALITLIAAGNVGACLVLTPLFDVHHKQPLAAVVALGAEVVALVVVLALAYTGTLGLVALGALVAVKWWLMTAAQYAVYHRAVRPLRLVLRREVIGRMLRSALPLAGSTVVAGLPANAGVFFVRLLGGDADAGVFGFAGYVAGAYLLFSNLALRILQPHIAGPYGLQGLFIRKLVLFAGLFLVVLYAAMFTAGAAVIWFLLNPPLPRRPWAAGAGTARGVGPLGRQHRRQLSRGSPPRAVGFMG
jgi:O-antigen/teichoic acid export membrane protein